MKVVMKVGGVGVCSKHLKALPRACAVCAATAGVAGEACVSIWGPTMVIRLHFLEFLTW